MKRVIRGLFEEREKKEIGKTLKFFDEDTISKILRLMGQYSFNQDAFPKGKVDTRDNFLNRLSYQLPEGTLEKIYALDGLKKYSLASSLNDFLSMIELFLTTLYDECSYYFYNNYSVLSSFINEFNDLLAIKLIPFRIEAKNENRIFIDRINSVKEEENKKLVYNLLKGERFKEVEEHFTNGLINFAKRKYPESCEEAYLALEKYLKIKVENHKIDAPKAYIEFKKTHNIERGIFKIYHKKIEEKIDLVYSIRSKIKSHSDENLFDRKDFLEETARFQLNEVMNLIILLEYFKEKQNE